MLVDIHVHTNRYSACGRSSPEEMVHQALAVGLDGLVFTEHDLVWPAQELDTLQAQFPRIKLFRAIEVSSTQDEHYLVYGCVEPSRLHQRMEAEELIPIVRSCQGTVVLAHPYRYHDEVSEALTTHRVDGIEVLSCNILRYAHAKAMRLCDSLSALPVAATDSHHTSTLGLYALRFTRAIQTEEQLALALRQGAFSLHVDRDRVAMDNAMLAEQMDSIHEMINQGLDDHAIRASMPTTTFTMLRGIRAGLDVYRPSL